MYGCESWTIKKAESWRIDAFELWCWRRLLRVPWTARRSNQSILKEISPEYFLEDWCWSWNSNTLATWCEQLTHLKRPWYWERLKAGGEGDNRGWDNWMASLTQWTWVWVNSGSWWWTGRPGVVQSMGSKESDTTDRLNWTEHPFLPLAILFSCNIFYLCSWWFWVGDAGEWKHFFLHLFKFSIGTPVTKDRLIQEKCMDLFNVNFTSLGLKCRVCLQWSLAWEDPLGKGMATHSSIPAWRIPWTEKPGGLQSMGLQRVGHDWMTNILHDIRAFIRKWRPEKEIKHKHLIDLLKSGKSWKDVIWQKKGMS